MHLGNCAPTFSRDPGRQIGFWPPIALNFQGAEFPSRESVKSWLKLQVEQMGKLSRCSSAASRKCVGEMQAVPVEVLTAATRPATCRSAGLESSTIAVPRRRLRCARVRARYRLRCDHASGVISLRNACASTKGRTRPVACRTAVPARVINASRSPKLTDPAVRRARSDFDPRVFRHERPPSRLSHLAISFPAREDIRSAPTPVTAGPSR